MTTAYINRIATAVPAADVLDVPIGTIMSRLAAVRLKLGALDGPAPKIDNQDAG